MSVASRAALTAVCGVLVIAVLASWQGVGLSDLQNLGTPRNSVLEGDREVTIPLPAGPAERRSAVVEPQTEGSYAFLFDVPGEGPVRYDPCRSISWVLSPAGMPEGTAPMLHEAVDQVSASTGLSFEYEGVTDEVADFDRDLVQARYGERFAPVVLGWSTEAENADLAGSVTGIGGSSAVNGAYGDQRYLRAGVVILDSEDVRALMASPLGEELAQATVMHEWAHVVGLAHVNDPSELMNYSNTSLRTWGPGDLRGLAIAGSGPCENA